MLLAADALEQRRHRALVGQVEAVQRLVEDQQPRLADERLRDQQPLLLAAGELADRPVGIGAAPTSSITCSTRSPPARRSGSPQRAPSSAEPHEVDAADPGAGVEVPALGQVADLPLVRARRPAQHPARSPRASASSPSNTRSSVVLPEPFGPEDRRELAPADLDVHVAPDHAPADPRLGRPRPRPRGGGAGGCDPGARRRARAGWADAHRPVARCRAPSRLLSSALCHCSKVAEAGESVSVTVVIGMCAARASWLTRCTSGVAFWLL